VREVRQFIGRDHAVDNGRAFRLERLADGLAQLAGLFGLEAHSAAGARQRLMFTTEFFRIRKEDNARAMLERGALADYEQLFRAQEVNKRMKDKAAHACHALFRARLVEEMRLRKGTSTAEHLKEVLSIIDGPRFP
jgi:hypothetical protein